MIKIVLADDHRIIIDAIADMLNAEQDISVVGIAENGLEALRVIEEKQPDLAVVDINMPGLDGIELTRSIKEKFADIKVVILSMSSDQTYVNKALEAGAKGYLLKNTGKEEFLLALKKIVGGGKYFASEITEAMLYGRSEDSSPLSVELSKKEMEVLRLIAKGLTNPQIAETLFRSEHTIKSHRKNLLSKLGVNNTAGLVRFAFKNDLVD